MTDEEHADARQFVSELRARGGRWPWAAPLAGDYGVRVCGYARAPGRVWLWAAVTLAAAGLAAWAGWRYGGPAGAQLFTGAEAPLLGQVVFGAVLAAGAVAAVRSVGVRVLERLIEPRFEVALTPESVDVGGWFGYKRHPRAAATPEFAIEPHPEGKAESDDAARQGQRGTGPYQKTQQVVLRYGGRRVVVASICADERGAEALHWYLYNADVALRRRRAA